MKLSIVIPTLNEAAYLERTLISARDRRATNAALEIIVADCGSEDDTAQQAARLGALVVAETPLPDRAAALNHGAAHATGEIILFLHADSLLPRGYDRRIFEALGKSENVGGAFQFALDGNGFGLRLVETINRIRYRWWPYFYGDQAIFVRRSVFQRLGGYPRLGILEDSHFIRRLRTCGKVVLINRFVETSARRFIEGGVYQVLAKDTVIWALDILGVSTGLFAASYRQNNRARGGSTPGQP